MNAKELTEKYYKDHADFAELQRKVEILQQFVDKLQLRVQDMDVDLRMMQQRKC